MKKFMNLIFEEEIIEDNDNVQIEDVMPRKEIDYEKKLIQKSNERAERLVKEQEQKIINKKPSSTRIDIIEEKKEEIVIKNDKPTTYKMTEPISPIYGSTKNEEKIVPVKLDNRVVKNESPLGLIISPIAGVVLERKKEVEEIKEEPKFSSVTQIVDNFHITDFNYEDSEENFLDTIINKEEETDKTVEISLFD